MLRPPPTSPLFPYTTLFRSRLIIAAHGFPETLQMSQCHAFVEGHLKKGVALDRKSTRLNSSHVRISYAVFCLKKKKHYGGAFQTKTAPAGHPPSTRAAHVSE